MLRRTACRLLVATALVAGPVVATPPASAAGVRVYALGDSITFGTTWTLPGSVPTLPRPAQDRRITTPGGYRSPLHLLLTASGLDHEFVGTDTGNPSPVLEQRGQTRHDGHPSYRVDHAAGALDGRAGHCCDNGGHWLTGTANRLPVDPDVVVIHLGTNDIGTWHDPGTTYPTANGKANLADPAQRAVFVANLTARLGTLVDKVQALAPEARIVLSTIVPITDARWDLTAYYYNQEIASLVDAERAAGAKIVLADVWSLFAAYVPATAGQPERVVVPPGVLSPDNGHPMPATYQAMAVAYRNAIVEVVAL